MRFAGKGHLASMKDAQKPRVEDTPQLRLPEIISALSFALDLTEGAVPGHALRSTLLGMRIGEAMGLPETLRSQLFYALQLKDIGCSSNAARVAQMFAGDDRAAKAMSKLTDWSGLMNSTPQRKGRRTSAGTSGRSAERSAKRSRGSQEASKLESLTQLVSGLRAVPRNLHMLWSVVEPGGSQLKKISRAAKLSRESETNQREVIGLRCERGAAVLARLQMSEEACAAVRHLDERWDGSGFPEGLRGEQIPVLARVMAAAQTLDVFASAFGVEASLNTLERRSGSWFDPEVVAVASALHHGEALWHDALPDSPVDHTRATVLRMANRHDAELRAEQIDNVCEAFAVVVDAKSPFTYRHSIGVTEVALALAVELGWSDERQHLIRRAALLHDVGKLGVSNMILDKPGALTPAERAAVFGHPAMSSEILGRISGFGEIAKIAGEHHERLDGSGYPEHLKAAELSTESRLLALADSFAAMTEQRSYQQRMPLETALALLAESVPKQFDADIFCALEKLVERWQGELPTTIAAMVECVSYAPAPLRQPHAAELEPVLV
jgi:putative nucleotidyltransferase with HDIG domain